MSGENLTLLKAATAKMSYDEHRIKVLSENIAQADTPGAQAKDLKPLDFKSILETSTSALPLAGGGLAATNSRHITSSAGSDSSGKITTIKEKDPYEVSPSGNSIILEEQMMLMNQTATDHQMTSNIYQKTVDMLKASTK